MDQDIIDNWKDAKVAATKKRAVNRETSAKFLQRQGVPFESKNNGAHLIISIGPMRVDFWPGTGLWTEKGMHHKTGRGVFKLWAHLEHCAWTTLLNNVCNPPPNKTFDYASCPSPTGRSSGAGPLVQNIPLNTPEAQRVKAALFAPLPPLAPTDDTPPWD